MRRALLRSSQSSTVSFAWLIVAKDSPCSRFTLKDLNNISVTASSEQLPSRSVKARRRFDLAPAGNPLLDCMTFGHVSSAVEATVNRTTAIERKRGPRDKEMRC